MDLEHPHPQAPRHSRFPAGWEQEGGAGYLGDGAAVRALQEPELLLLLREEVP